LTLKDPQPAAAGSDVDRRDLADDAVVQIADARGVDWPRPLVAGRGLGRFGAGVFGVVMVPISRSAGDDPMHYFRQKSKSIKRSRRVWSLRIVVALAQRICALDWAPDRARPGVAFVPRVMPLVDIIWA
jgi:hypothetical protein